MTREERVKSFTDWLTGLVGYIKENPEKVVDISITYAPDSMEHGYLVSYMNDAEITIKIKTKANPF